MPRNGSGVASKPAGTTFVPNTVIESAKANSVIDDIYSLLNSALPITAGGTGATTAGAARTALGVDPSRTFVTKSAGYTALAADKAANIRFDGAYTLSLTAAATLGSGWYCYVQADGGAVTIDPNSSETINGAATLVLPDGYSTIVWCDGSNFRALEDFLRIDNWVDVASATTTDIGAAASQNVRITGTTTITGLGTVAAGTFRRVRFAGILTLTHNGTSLILPGAANIITAAGDVGEFISEGSGNWRCVDYTKAAGDFGAGSITTTTLAASTTVTGINSTTRNIVCSITGIQPTAANTIIVQLGTGGSLTTSGYSGSGSRLASAASASVSQTNGLVIYTNSSAEIVSGKIECILLDEAANQWIMTFTGSHGTTLSFNSSTVVSLAGTVDRIALVANSGNITAGGKINMRQFS